MKVYFRNFHSFSMLAFNGWPYKKEAAIYLFIIREEIHWCTWIKNDNILSITNINQSILPKILRPGKSGRESRVVAPLHVRPSQYGLPSVGMLKRGVEVHEGGSGVRKSREIGKDRQGGVHQPSLISVECVCALCVSPIDMTSCWVLFPLCGARWFGGQIIHDSGDAWDLLDLIYHLQHHLGKQIRQITPETLNNQKEYIEMLLLYYSNNSWADNA